MSLCLEGFALMESNKNYCGETKYVIPNTSVYLYCPLNLTTGEHFLKE